MRYGFPRWVGATGVITGTTTDENGTLVATLNVHVPRIRGYIWAALHVLTRRTADDVSP